MTTKRKQYDYIDAIMLATFGVRGEEACASGVGEEARRLPRILRRLVREAVVLAANDIAAELNKTGPEHAKDIARYLIP